MRGRRGWGLRSRLALVNAMTLLGVGGVLLSGGYLALDTWLPRDVDGGWIDAGQVARAVVTPTGGVGSDQPRELTSVDGLPVPDDVTWAEVAPSTVEALNLGVGAYRERVLADVMRIGGLALVLAAVLVAALSHLTARRTLAPVRAIARTAGRLGEDGPWDERIPVAGRRDEGAVLARTFNQMLDRLEEGRRRDRLLVANLAHELRTPLATQRVVLEVAQDATTLREAEQARREALRQNERTAALAESMLLLSAAAVGGDGPDGGDGDEVVDLADLVGDVVEELRAQVPGLAWEVSLAPAPVQGGRVLWERAVLNLLDNAARHNRDLGGWVRVATVSEGAVTSLRIVNSGPVVAAQEIPGLLEPLRRGGSDRRAGVGGYGLGLAIVASVLERLGVALLITPGPDGGLAVEVRTAPLIPPSAPGCR